MARSEPAAKASTTDTSTAAANSPTKAKQKKSKKPTCPPSWRIIDRLKTAALKKTITGEEEEEEEEEIVDSPKQLASPTKDHSSNKEEEEEAEISPTNDNNKDYDPPKKIAPKTTIVSWKPMKIKLVRSSSSNEEHLDSVQKLTSVFCLSKNEVVV